MAIVFAAQRVGAKWPRSFVILNLSPKIARLFSDDHDPCGGRAPAEDGLRGVAVQIAAGTARGSRAELAERRARWNEGRGALAMWLRPGGVPRDERAETPHTGIADVLQQIAILVREPPQHVVEDLPARWIGRRSGLTRQLQKFPWHLHGTGQ